MTSAEPFEPYDAWCIELPQSDTPLVRKCRVLERVREKLLVIEPYLWDAEGGFSDAFDTSRLILESDVYSYEREPLVRSIMRRRRAIKRLQIELAVRQQRLDEIDHQRAT